MPKGIYKRIKPNYWIGRKHKKESIERMRQANKGKHFSPSTEFKKGMTPWNKNKKLPQFSGKNNPNWKDGQFIRKGYVYIYSPNHPYARKKYIKRSRLVIEQHLGRYLKPEELVHHKGIHFPIDSIENKQDDSPENLQLFTKTGIHSKYHYPKGSKFGIHTL